MDLILLNTVEHTGSSFVTNILKSHNSIFQLGKGFLDVFEYEGEILPYINSDFIEKLDFPLRCEYVFIKDHIDRVRSLSKYLILFQPIDFKLIMTIRHPYDTIHSTLKRDNKINAIAVATRILTSLWFIKKYNPFILQIDMQEDRLETILSLFQWLGLDINNDIKHIADNWDPVNVGNFDRSLTTDQHEFILGLIKRLDLINKIEEVTGIEYNIS